MTLPKFEYLVPLDLKEACSVLKDLKDGVAICAGGTELVMDLKQRLKNPAYVLSLKKLTELSQLRYSPDVGFVLGAAYTLSNLSRNTGVRSELTALAQAAGEIASPQIRTRATIGGNVCLNTRCWYYNRSKQWRVTFPPCYKTGGNCCHVAKGGKQCYALCQADTVPPLLVMKAKLKLVNSASESLIPIEDFYSGRGEVPNRLSTDQLVTEIHIPSLPPYSGTFYLKYRQRENGDFPILGVASLVRLDNAKKICLEARFAFTGIGSSPLLIEATDTLKGMEDSELNDDQVERLLRGIRPLTHMGISASLKRRILKVLLGKAFTGSWRIAQEKMT